MSFACVFGPQILSAKSDLGFEFKADKSPQCENCSMISIDAPIEYDGHPASHAIFSVFLNGDLVSKSLATLEIESKKAKFVGIVSKEKGFSYELNIEYGTVPCMSYKFTYSGSENDS